MSHSGDPDAPQELSDDELSDTSSDYSKCNWHCSKLSTDYYKKSFSIADALRMPNRKCSSIHFIKLATGVHPHSSSMNREKSNDTISISHSEKKAAISATNTCPGPSTSSVRSETLDFIDMLSCLKPDASHSDASHSAVPCSSKVPQVQAKSDDENAEVTRDPGPISAPTSDIPPVSPSINDQPEPLSIKEADTEQTEQNLEALPKTSSEESSSLDVSSLKSHLNEFTSINAKAEALSSLESDFARLLGELEVEYPTIAKNDGDLSLLLECTETDSTLATAKQVDDEVLKCSSTTITDGTIVSSGCESPEINTKMSVTSLTEANKAEPATLFKSDSKLSCCKASTSPRESKGGVNIAIDGKVSATSFNIFCSLTPSVNGGELARSSSKVSVTTLSASVPENSNAALETTSNPIFSNNFEDSGIQSMSPTISCASLSHTNKIKTTRLKSRSECNTLSTLSSAASANKEKTSKGLLERRAVFGMPTKNNTRLKPRPKMTTMRESPNNLTPEGVDAKSKPQQKTSPIGKPPSSTKYKVNGRFSPSYSRKIMEKPKETKTGENLNTQSSNRVEVASERSKISQTNSIPRLSSRGSNRAEVASERSKISQTTSIPRPSSGGSVRTAAAGIRNSHGGSGAQKSKPMESNPQGSLKRINETGRPSTPSLTKTVQPEESITRYQSASAKTTWKYDPATHKTKRVASIPKPPPWPRSKTKSKIPSLRSSPKTNEVYEGVPTVNSTTSSVNTTNQSRSDATPHDTKSLPLSHVSDAIASSSKISIANKSLNKYNKEAAITNSHVKQFSTEMLYKSICADIEASRSVVDQSFEQSQSPSNLSASLRSTDTMDCLLGSSSSKIELAKVPSAKKSKSVTKPRRLLVLRKKKCKHGKSKLQALQTRSKTSALPKQQTILAKKLRRCAYYRLRLLRHISICKRLLPKMKKLKRTRSSNTLRRSTTWESINSSVKTSRSKSSYYSCSKRESTMLPQPVKDSTQNKPPSSVETNLSFKKFMPPAPFKSKEVITPKKKGKEVLKSSATMKPKHSSKVVPPREYVTNFPQEASTSEIFQEALVQNETGELDQKPSPSVDYVLADEPVCTYKIINSDQLPESAKALLKKKLHGKTGKTMNKKSDMLRAELEKTRSKLSTASVGSSDTFTKSSTDKFVSVNSISDELLKRDYPCLNAIVSKSLYFESLDSLGEGDAVPKTSEELPVDKARSSRSTCIRKSRMLKTYRDLDPSDIIKKIRRIRNKLAEASKLGSPPISEHKARRRLRTWNYGFSVCTIYHLGEKGSGLRSRGDVQDFYELRDEHLSNGTLFEDPDFPADDSSLFFSRRPDRHYEWLRPGEIVDDPQLFVEGYSRFDVQQGELGDCWLLAAVANLTLYRRLFFQIVPDDQGFEEKYAGIFHFRFWQYGRWVDVVIDDRLPTYRGQLVFLHSTEENEFWSALLEKAYAKLHGSYEALKGGSTCEAMEDFTGGVTEMYEMNATPPNLFKIILKAYERGSLMGASLEPDPEVLEAETQDGLIRGHAYSITRVKFVDIQTPNTAGKIPLLRLRNPWGNESEWKGPWSDESPEWRFIPEHEKEDLGLTFDNDGEFWMSFKDFQTHFDRLEICNLTPDSLTEEELTEGHKKKWEMSVFEGEWVRGVTAGGCRNYLDTFWHNPQYRITLTDVDEDDDDSKCTVIVALMQKNRRSRRLMGVEFLTIGFAIYYLPNPNGVPKPLDHNYFKYNASVARSPSFINLREVSCRFRLPPGTYCIVPSTFDPNEEGEFLLRVFSEHQNHMEENDEEVGIGEVDTTIAKHTPTVEENQETDKVREFFLKLAGEDLEVDWQELKEILDYAMRNELPVNKASVRGVEAGVGGTETTSQSNSFLTELLGLICTRFCKDSPLADIVPAPEPASTVQVAPTSHSSYETNKGFSKDVCRSMVAMLDTDRSGKLGYEEFKNLWMDIRNWKLVFKMYDKDNSSALSGFELRQALHSAGYKLNNHILNILMHRYGNKSAELNFDDFILCAVKLKTMIELFKQKDPDGTNRASFSMEDWIETTLYS